MAATVQMNNWMFITSIILLNTNAIIRNSWIRKHSNTVGIWPKSLYCGRNCRTILGIKTEKKCHLPVSLLIFMPPRRQQLSRTSHASLFISSSINTFEIYLFPWCQSKFTRCFTGNTKPPVTGISGDGNKPDDTRAPLRRFFSRVEVCAHLPEVWSTDTGIYHRWIQTDSPYRLSLVLHRAASLSKVQIITPPASSQHKQPPSCLQ